jgi:hypothetical protein
MTHAQYSTYCFPFDVRSKQRRRQGRIEHTGDGLDWVIVRSIAGTDFKIAGKPQFYGDGHSNEERLAGYWVSFNAPTNSVGNNVLLVNGVPAACRLAVLHLQRWCLQEGCSPEGARLLDFEQMRLHAVTPTFLHRLGSRAEALSVCRDVRLAMELHNSRRDDDKTRAEPAFGVGPSYESTGYLKTREVDLAAYVKDRLASTSHEFASDDIRLAIHDEGECDLRLESLLKGAFLSRTGLDYVDAWRLYGGDGPYPMIYAKIRELLFLDIDLRSDEPSGAEIDQKLQASDAAVVRWHLDGRNARQHANVVGERDRLAQQKYFSDLKKRVLARLRVDLSIPWARQRAADWDRLREVLRYPGMFSPPLALQDHIFGPHAEARLVLQLEADIARLAPRRLSSVLLDPLGIDPPPLEIRALKVTTEARRLLTRHRIPLHAVLRCHKLGGFGDVEPADATVQQAALIRGERITSQFRVGSSLILVSTDQNTGATSVCCE